MDERFWKERYIQMKDCYDKLLKIRIKAVSSDLEELRAKAKENEQMHRISIEEMENNIRELENKNETMKATIAKFEKCVTNIERMKNDLSRRNRILECVFSVKGIQLIDVSSNDFQFIAGTNEPSLSFSINRSAPFTYKPLTVYVKELTLPTWAQRETRFQDLNDLKSHLEELINVCFK